MPSKTAIVTDALWRKSLSAIRSLGKSGFDVFPGSEVFLLRGLRAGGKGCITATANINPGGINQVYEQWQTPAADALQAGITATRGIVQKYFVISALKAAIAHWGRDPDWVTVRPPLVELTAEQQRTLVDELAAAGFDMAGLAG